MKPIQLHEPCTFGAEEALVSQVLKSGDWGGDSAMVHICEKWFEESYGVSKVLLTHSCTGALELAALLCGLEEGDEVIMPSFTHPSTANAFMRCGAKPVFADIRADTMNLDTKHVASLCTAQTRAIVPMHYAGVSCEMNRILEIAKAHDLQIIEDAAHACHSQYHGKALGTMGTLGCLSFHATKLISCGEGGAIFINEPHLIERAEILLEKGTNRAAFRRGECSYYEWKDIGSSFAPSAMSAAVLFAQLQGIQKRVDAHRQIWSYYLHHLEALAQEHGFSLPSVPLGCDHNGYIFYIILSSHEERDALSKYLDEQGIASAFHFMPLHESEVGKMLGSKQGDLPVTEGTYVKLLRLPCHAGLMEEDLERVVDAIQSFFQTVKTAHNVDAAIAHYEKA